MNLDSAELTVIQYARLHGIAVDYLAEPLPELRVEGLQDHIQESLSDDTHLPQPEPSLCTGLLESLNSDKGCAELLQGASSGLTTPEELEAITSALLDTRQTTNIRLESPLLQTDHEADFRNFARWESSHFKDGCLPWEPLDDELDVGVEWPKKVKNLPANIFKELGSEKLEIQKDAVYYLQATVKGDWTQEEDRKVWESAMSYKRNFTLGPVTPPLLAQSPEPMAYILSSPGCHLPFLSDPLSLISEDLRKAETAIFEQDFLLNPVQHSSSPVTSPTTLVSKSHVNPLDTFLQAGSLEGEETLLVSSYIKAEDHKVEEPLVPLTPITSLPKSVTFNDVVEEMLLDGLSLSDQLESPISAFEEAFTFLKDAFGDTATNANRKIEQEQLQQEDANSRVQVPFMDFSLPKPPWEFPQSQGDSTKVLEIRKEMIADLQRQCRHLAPWPGIKKVTSQLRWTIFPSELAKVSFAESFGDDEELRGYLSHEGSDKVIDSSQLTWKPSGFRILQEISDDDDDEIDFGFFPTGQSQDIAVLVRKRKMQFEEKNSHLNTVADALATRVRERKSLIDTGQDHQMTNNEMQSTKNGDHLETSFLNASVLMENKPAYDRADNINFLHDGHFSPSTALNNFLEIRASKKQKSMQSAHFAGNSTVSQLSKSASASHPARPTLPVKAEKMYKPLPSPPINPARTPAPYIVSSVMLKRRSLIRTIQSLYPDVVPIERNFSTHNRTAWMPNSTTRSPISSPLDSEADFIISPSTGVIITTLQKIKQKPLPGQKAKSAFKAQVEKVSMRYERLIVLVSEANKDESTSGLAESDIAALVEATGYCSSLEGTTRLQFVGGGEETLAKWLVATILQYGSQGESSVLLLEDETLWELFLRRMGMNAYAAQAVIAEFKAPDGVDVEGGSKAGLFGIIAFVEMDQHEREARLERLLGGCKVLRLVGRVLDIDWP